MGKHFARVAVIVVVVVGAMLGFAATAQALPTYSSQCTGCHSGSGPSVVATPVSNNGTVAVYNVTVTNGSAWALFNGSTKLTYAAATTGQFSVAVPGTYQLFAVNGPTTSDGVAMITLSPVAPPTAGSLSGTVTNASSLAAISGVTVSISGTALTTTTNALGQYSFATVPAGAGTANFAMTGYVSQAKAFSVTSGANTVLNAALAPPAIGSISGTVTNASTLAAVSGATVSVTGTSLTTTTNALGQYSFASVPVGSGSLGFSATGYVAQSQAFTVTTGANTVVNAALAVPQIGTISGTVTDASSTVGISGATVSITGTSFTTTTNALGQYSFASVPVGSGTLAFSAASHLPLSKPFTVALNANTVVDAALAKQTGLPVCRFYDTRTGTHFYTSDPDEKASVIAHLPWYRYEGVAYTVNMGNPANSSPLYRFYDKENGTHFYTADLAERNRVISTMSDRYSYDGPAYNVSLTNVPGSTTVTRFFNKVTGAHFYTADSSETANVMNSMSAMYSLDGAAFYLAP